MWVSFQLFALFVFALTLQMEPVHTSAADCKVYDNVNDIFYDLAPLHSYISNYTLNLNYTFAICRALNDPTHCHGIQNAGSCFISANQSLGVAGDAPVISKNGNISLTYTGGSSCPGHKKVYSRTTINFICDPTNSSVPTVVYHANICALFVTFPTIRVCPPPPATPCFVGNFGASYDLSRHLQVAGWCKVSTTNITRLEYAQMSCKAIVGNHPTRVPVCSQQAVTPAQILALFLLRSLQRTPWASLSSTPHRQSTVAV